eukprot:gene13064-biopygen9533
MTPLGRACAPRPVLPAEAPHHAARVGAGVFEAGDALPGPESPRNPRRQRGFRGRLVFIWRTGHGSFGKVGFRPFQRGEEVLDHGHTNIHRPASASRTVLPGAPGATQAPKVHTGAFEGAAA